MSPFLLFCLLSCWQRLPHILANGRVLFFNVTCRSQSGRALTDVGSCRDLCSENTTCSLWLPPAPCSCALTASNSVGPSPEARIWLPGAAETGSTPLNFLVAALMPPSSLEADVLHPHLFWWLPKWKSLSWWNNVWWHQRNSNEVFARSLPSLQWPTTIQVSSRSSCQNLYFQAAALLLLKTISLSTTSSKCWPGIGICLSIVDQTWLWHITSAGQRTSTWMADPHVSH